MSRAGSEYLVEAIWIRIHKKMAAHQSGLGHLPATYSDGNFLHHVYGGIYWAAIGNGFTPN